MIFALLACAPEAPLPVADDVVTVEHRVPLDAPRLLRRTSLDLRGVLPDEAELDAVEADAAALDGLAAAYLEDPRLEERLVSLLAERWHTVMDEYEVNSGDYGLPSFAADDFAHAVGEEPLRIVARVVVEDRPWSEVVTADWTMANGLLAGVWPLVYPEGGEGWEESRYTDGRPAAGVLATNGLWWRYVTNVSNRNRGRVAAISRLLLCTDVLSRPVVFSRDDGEDPEEAIRTNPTCIACHASIDPIAAALFGFWWTIMYNPYEMDTYHPEREPLGPELLEVEPAWYGQPMSGLADLGWYVANDPRYPRCAAQSFAEQLWRRDATIEDFATIEQLRADFVADGQRPRALLAAVLATPAYRAGGYADDAPEDARTERVERMLSPNQLRTVTEDLTGFVWTWGGYTQLENDVAGYRTLGGGVDGYSVGAVQQDPGLTWALVVQRVAEGAAHAAVQRDLGEGAHALLRGVDAATVPTDAAFGEELRSLHWRLYAERPDDAWVDAATALWTEVAEADGAEAAWAAVLTAALRDPRFVSY